MIDVACRGNEISFHVRDNDSTPMDAFDDVPTGDLGQNGRRGSYLQSRLSPSHPGRLRRLPLRFHASIP